MPNLYEFVAEFENLVEGREHFLVVASPGVGKGDHSTNPICGITINEQSHDVLLLYSLLPQSDQQLTVAELSTRLKELLSSRQTFSVGLTRERDESGTEDGEGSIVLRFDCPVRALSINDQEQTAALHWV